MDIKKNYIIDKLSDHTARVESNDALAVNTQNLTTAPIDLFFIQQIGSDTALTNATDVDDTDVVLDSVADVSVGDFLGIFSGTSLEGRFYFAEVLAVVSNTVSLDTPLDFAFDAGDPVISSTRDLNVDGSTMQMFTVSGAGMGSPVVIDITRLIFQLTDDTAMDDGKFGGIAALTKGMVLRRNNSTMNNIYNIKSNGDFGIVSFDKVYADKAPAGLFGLTVRSSFAGQEKHGVSIRLATGESLEILIQDDLTELTSFRAMAQGHIVLDNS